MQRGSLGGPLRESVRHRSGPKRGPVRASRVDSIRRHGPVSSDGFSNYRDQQIGRAVFVDVLVVRSRAADINSRAGQRGLFQIVVITPGNALTWSTPSGPMASPPWVTMNRAALPSGDIRSCIPVLTSSLSKPSWGM